MIIDKLFYKVIMFEQNVRWNLSYLKILYIRKNELKHLKCKFIAESY